MKKSRYAVKSKVYSKHPPVDGSLMFKQLKTTILPPVYA